MDGAASVNGAGRHTTDISESPWSLQDEVAGNDFSPDFRMILIGANSFPMGD
jgi:hypothetical protein